MESCSKEARADLRIFQIAKFRADEVINNDGNLL